MLKTLIVTVVGSLIIWFVQERYKDAPTITYTVSDAIEIVGSQGKTEYAQEISISNPGRSEVKAISVKVPRPISSYKLSKHSRSTKEETYLEQNVFELLYPELPAAQKITLLVRYDHLPVERNSISISSAAGNAQAQDATKNFVDYALLLYVFWAGVLFTLVIDFRSFQKKLFVDLGWSKEALFRDDKPWYAVGAKWSDIQFEAIERAMQRYSYSSLKEKLCYVLLDRAKPELMSQDHWDKLKKQAVELMEAALLRELASYKGKNDLIELLKLRKPENLPLKSWEEFQVGVQTRLKEVLLPLWMKEHELIGILESNSPTLKDIPDSLANEIRRVAQDRYCDYLIKKMVDSYSVPSTFLDNARLDLLSAEQSSRVKERFQRLAKIAAMPASLNISDLRHFVEKGRPKFISEREFESARDYVQKMDALCEEQGVLEARLAKLKTSETETSGLKERVTAQLDLIDRVLANPDSISRIEDYDKTFSPGNRKNLELVASILKQNVTVRSSGSRSSGSGLA